MTLHVGSPDAVLKPGRKFVRSSLPALQGKREIRALSPGPAGKNQLAEDTAYIWNFSSGQDVYLLVYNLKWIVFSAICDASGISCHTPLQVLILLLPMTCFVLLR
jgi:hypothetical protein